MKILLLEDDYILNELITDSLTDIEFNVKSVFSGNEALEELRKEKIFMI